MSKRRTYFKVVSLWGSARVSYNTGGDCLNQQMEVDGSLLRYGTDIVTVPKIPDSALFVFSTQEAAMGCYGDRQEIWECEVTNPRRLIRYYKAADRCKLKSFWRNRKNKRCQSYGYSDTVIVDSVRLLKRVQ